MKKYLLASLLADGVAHPPRRRHIRRPALLRRLIAAIKQNIHHRHIRRIHRAQMRIKKLSNTRESGNCANNSRFGR